LAKGKNFLGFLGGGAAREKAQERGEREKGEEKRSVRL
jgi:hypothetical protein